MGDRWISTDLGASTYVWLPLTISGTTATLVCTYKPPDDAPANGYQTNEVNWILDISAGTWTTGPSETTPEAESSSNILSGGAIILSCSGCSGSESVGYIGGSSNGILTFPDISSSVSTTTTIRIHYENGDASQRYANVVVNGVTHIVAFVPTASGSTPGTSTLTVPLKSGSQNVITFEGYNGGWGK